MPENQIYEISRMMRDRAATQKDMRDASVLLSQFFQDRYLSKIKQAVDMSQSSVNASPPDEVRLLNALKPFVSPERHAQVDRMVNMMMTMSAVKKMSSDLNPGLTRDAGEAAGNPVAGSGPGAVGGRGAMMNVFALLAMLGR